MLPMTSVREIPRTAKKNAGSRDDAEHPYLMNDKPQFRRAGELDAEILLQFMRAYYALDGHGFDETKARVALIALLRDANLGGAWIILDGSEAVGYIVLCYGYSLEWLGRDAFVDEFYLREEYRGRGWGRRAMEFLEEEARLAGVRALHLEVVEGNEAAGELYRKIGFKRHASTFFSKWIARDFSKSAGKHGY